MLRTVIVTVGVSSALALIGCARRSPQPPAQQPPPAVTTVPSDSKLARVRPGMSPEEVEKILGEPTSRNAYVTGKAFIPFYYGPDQARTGWFYKGLGRVVFETGGGFRGTLRVQRVEHDPDEDGQP